MTIKIAITFAFLFSISAMVKSQSTQAFVNTKMAYASASTTKDSNSAYRSVGNTRYLILNPSEETLLYQLESQPSENQPAVIQYYFSRGTGEVRKLTILNIKNEFASDLQFHEALDAEFRSDEELASYDSLPRLAALFEIRAENSLLASN